MFTNDPTRPVRVQNVLYNQSVVQGCGLCSCTYLLRRKSTTNRREWQRKWLTRSPASLLGFHPQLPSCFHRDPFHDRLDVFPLSKWRSRSTRRRRISLFKNLRRLSTPPRYNYYFDHFIFFPNSCLGFVSGVTGSETLEDEKVKQTSWELGIGFWWGSLIDFEMWVLSYNYCNFGELKLHRNVSLWQLNLYC